MQFHVLQYLYNMKTLRKKLWTHFPGSPKNTHLTPWLSVDTTNWPSVDFGPGRHHRQWTGIESASGLFVLFCTEYCICTVNVNIIYMKSSQKPAQWEFPFYQTYGESFRIFQMQPELIAEWTGILPTTGVGRMPLSTDRVKHTSLWTEWGSGVEFSRTLNSYTLPVFHNYLNISRLRHIR